METIDLFKLPTQDGIKISRIHDGYGYSLNYRTQNRCYLACLKKNDPKLKCKGRIILENNKIKEISQHNHPSDEFLEEKRKLNHAVKTIARQNTGSFRQCYEKLSKDFPEAVSKQSYRSLSQLFRRWSTKCQAEDKMKRSPAKMKTQNSVPKIEIKDVEQFTSLLSQDPNLCTYNTTISNKKSSHQITSKLIKDGRYRHLVLYDNNLMDAISDARHIIVHKMTSIVPKKCGTHLITIMFEKYEKALSGLWILMGGDEEFCYQILFKYMKLIFPYFNPKQAVVDYDKCIQNGLIGAFPNIDIIPSFLHQTQSIFENALKTNAAVKFNRIRNPEKHALLRKFIALSLLPRDYIISSFHRLITECKAKHGTYFNSFIEFYTKEWLDVWTPEALSIYRLKYLMKNFLECYQYRQNFEIGKELRPLFFIERIKNVLIKTRTDLVLLEKGEVLSYYLVLEDQEREKKLYKTWDRLDRDFITMNEALVICSNLLHEDFIDTLPDFVVEEKKKIISNNNADSVAPKALGESANEQKSQENTKIEPQSQKKNENEPDSPKKSKIEQKSLEECALKN